MKKSGKLFDVAFTLVFVIAILVINYFEGFESAVITTLLLIFIEISVTGREIREQEPPHKETTIHPQRK